jgi:hypothetical protein
MGRRKEVGASEMGTIEGGVREPGGIDEGIVMDGREGSATLGRLLVSGEPSPGSRPDRGCEDEGGSPAMSKL